MTLTLLTKFAKVLSNVVVLLGLFWFSGLAMETFTGGELLVYFLSLAITALLRKFRPRRWFYFGLVAFDVLYFLPLFAYYVLGWRDM